MTAEIKVLYDERGIPYLLEATGEEAVKVNMALKKQIPKKPNETEGYPHRLFCSNCYFTFCFNKDNLDGIKALQMYNHCPNCGQAIDWSDSE